MKPLKIFPEIYAQVTIGYSSEYRVIRNMKFFMQTGKP